MKKTAVDKRTLTEDILVNLMYDVASNLLTKVQTGKASHQDISNAIKLLQHNGITVAVNKGNPLDVLSQDLPFHGDFTVSN